MSRGKDGKPLGDEEVNCSVYPLTAPRGNAMDGGADTGLVTSMALVSAAIGALPFGRVTDMIGRKHIYGWSAHVVCRCSPFGVLAEHRVADRAALYPGIGIGGAYPMNATIMSEYTGKATRRTLVAVVFAMQAAGLMGNVF